MKKAGKIALVAVFMLMLPMAAAADQGMQHMAQKEGMDHGKTHGMEHGEMMMEEGMVMLGEQTEAGVKAMAHLNDVREAMAKMGMKETHHFMIAFVDAAGEQVTEGAVAVKIKDPAGNVSDPVKLMGMEGHFGADVVLNEAGKYEFMVGTKLKDGEKRQYHFEYTVK